MRRRDSIFDRLALKEKVSINQQMRNWGALNSELRKIEDMRIKLSEMAEDATIGSNAETAFTLRSAAELNYQIRDQLATANNRSDHLNEELKHMQQNIALSDRRRRKSARKADEIRHANREELAARNEDDEASRRKNCRR